MLIDHLFSGPLNYDLRYILAVTMPYVLECDLKPFPFKKFGQFFKCMPNNGLSFFQHITDPKVESFSDKIHNLSFSDQRNYSADATLEWKEYLCTWVLQWQQSTVDDDKKTIPVQHAILDFQATNLFHKIR